MAPSIDRLQAIFRENSLHNLRALRRMSDKVRGRLDSSVYAWFASFKHLYLPHLSNISVETFVLMRQYHGDTFQRYNATVQRFFSDTSSTKTEQRMLELMHETDESIRKLDAEINKISSSKALQAGGIAVKLAAAALCPLLLKEAAPMALSILGGNIVSDTTRYIQMRKERKAACDASPFYFPWLVHTTGHSG